MKEQTKEPEQHNRHEPKKRRQLNDRTKICCKCVMSGQCKCNTKTDTQKHIVPAQNEGENARLSSGVNSDVDEHQKQPWLKKKTNKIKKSLVHLNLIIKT